MPETAFHVYLASKSPRRKELLTQMGLSFKLLDVHVDEDLYASEAVEDYVRRLALEKAHAGRKIAANPGTPVIGSDTCIYFNARIIGKPKDKSHAIAILKNFSGQQHEVITAVAVCNEYKSEVVVQRSKVTMRKLSDHELEAYWASGEPCDKAGAYAIQGLGALFISSIEGSYSGIVGLPIYETAQLLKQFGVDCI